MDDLFLLVSKAAGLAVRVESWIVVGLVVALLAQARGRGRRAVWATALTLGLVAGLAAFPLGDLGLRRLEARFPADPPLAQVDGIIVLGGAEDVGPHHAWGGVQLNGAAERLIAGAELALRFPTARLIYAGGVGSLTSSDAQAPSRMARDQWLRLGVAADRIALESASRSTAENARLVRDVVKPQPGQVYVLVTSAFHMPRAMATFDRAGWSGLVAYPVDFRSGDLSARPGWQLGENLIEANAALKEYLGLVGYRVLGR